MLKLPTFLTKLTTPQIYGIFGFATVLFVLISFLVFQNIQNYTSASSQNSANSQISNPILAQNSTNSPSNSAISNSVSLSSSSISNIYSSNSSQNSQNLSSNSASLSNNSQSSISQKNTQESKIENQEDIYFKGKIGDLPIRMVLTKKQNDSNFLGYYLYEKNSTNKLQLNCNFLGAGIAKFECQETEISDNLGQVIKKTGNWSGETAPSNMDKVTGTWTNDDKTVNLPFSLEKVEKFNIEDFLKKSENKVENSTKLTYDERIIKNDFE